EGGTDAAARRPRRGGRDDGGPSPGGGRDGEGASSVGGPLQPAADHGRTQAGRLGRALGRAASTRGEVTPLAPAVAARWPSAGGVRGGGGTWLPVARVRGPEPDPMTTTHEPEA